MENVWVMAAVWVGLALIATLVAIWLRISTALSEIVVGTVAQLVIGALLHAELGGKTTSISFLAGTGEIVLTVSSTRLVGKIRKCEPYKMRPAFGATRNR